MMDQDDFEKVENIRVAIYAFDNDYYDATRESKTFKTAQLALGSGFYETGFTTAKTILDIYIRNEAETSKEIKIDAVHLYTSTNLMKTLSPTAFKTTMREDYKSPFTVPPGTSD